MYRAWCFCTTCGISAAVLGGCSGDELQPSEGPVARGVIEVSASTTGKVLDPDGYTLSVDSKFGGTLGSNSRITLQEVSGEHEIELAGVAPNCTVDGGALRPVTVRVSDTARVGFQITCQPTFGSVEITTETTGDTPDPDGYTVSIDGIPRPERIPTTGASTISGITVGHHFLQLTDVAPNCSISAQAPVAFDVTAAAPAGVRLQLNCLAFGRLQITTRTHGKLPDLQNYGFRVDSETEQPIGINASQTAQVAPGTHSVSFLELPGNCVLRDSAIRSVTINSNVLTKLLFQIDCGPPGTGQIRVLTQSTGVPQGIGAFMVNVDGRNSQSIGLSSSVTFVGLSSGPHIVQLTGVPPSCAFLLDNPREVTVSPGTTVRVLFDVVCFWFPY